MSSVFVALESMRSNESALALLRKSFSYVQFATNRESALQELVASGHVFDAVIVGVKEKVDHQILEKLPRIKVLGTVTVGLDHIDVTDINSRGITLVTAKGINAHAVAEHIIMMTLVLIKNALVAHMAVANGLDRKGLPELPKELRGKTVGLVGAGDTANALLNLLRPFHCHIHAWTFHPDKHEDLLSLGVTFTPLESIFDEADIISLHLPLSAQTKGFVSIQLIKRMRDSAILINAARKEIFDADLLNALQEKPNVKIGIDDFGLSGENYFQIIKDRCILTPHVAGVTEESLHNMELAVAKGVSAAFLQH